MKTYILGAGASRHAGYPLMAQLGAALLDWLGQNKDLNYVVHWMNVNHLFQMYGGLIDIERILTELVECPANSPVAKLQPAISAQIRGSVQSSIRAFFNDLAASEASLYRRLACERLGKNDALITFNYDISLEREMKSAGLWEVGNGYGFAIDGLPKGNAKVLKLHGSVNWSGLIFKGKTGSYVGVSSVLGPRPVIFTRPEFKALGYSTDLIDPECIGISQAPLEFCFILPTLSKRFYFQTSFGREWEHFFRALWGQAHEVLSASEEVIIIGYSFPCSDVHVRKLLFQGVRRDARLVICSGSDNGRLCKMFQDEGFQRITNVPSGHFEQYLDGGEF